MTTREPHTCGHRWCENTGTNALPGEHNCGAYVPATGSARAEKFELRGAVIVGAGVSFDEPDMVHPVVWLHINGDGRDVQVDFTIHEATQFEARLADAITTAMTVQPTRIEPDMTTIRECRYCHRETDRAGWRFDQLCADCDYCHRYSHLGNPCGRCGFPDYECPPSKLEGPG